MVAVMFSFGLYAQLNVSKGKVIINFGIDADVHSGVVTYNSFGDAAFGTDDWFQGASGLGVIDETQGMLLFKDRPILLDFFQCQYHNLVLLMGDFG